MQDAACRRTVVDTAHPSRYMKAGQNLYQWHNYQPVKDTSAQSSELAAVAHRSSHLDRLSAHFH